ncbi:hypothetical protein [Pseudophaeobacter sp. EL27]|uniref:hypothetical protein n=1 Tax=Pseudophaeobacter sp. EL27 TaxID=2107580 RepID=UPI0013C48DBF|nr:hypothetical protein [Pseudophaeobacter sp. EL27]
MDLANGPAVFKLQPNHKARRGWIAKFNQGMAGINQKGDITINETGTLMVFRFGNQSQRARLHLVNDTP